ncbi:MAG: type II toxin-antitoxin system RelE/ParE family toxin [Alphaproteobacteria bacterium]|nr:type II toxin-antitoxin system RelE/ParE family toxin [Alphaproteobacteria bacterium]MBU2270451.1 type II toxin-antitoxin system RelE/ParE family toxin [Alphaproteobacteria bacterium]MBU2419440.1 type II toxin-antitoxin system RelE/ParE family toxin [Alphaproteobacteria bacterium]
MKVRLTRRASLDIRRQIDWLAERSPRSAAKAARTIFDAVGRLGRHPYSGWSTDRGEREAKVRFGQSGFIVRYEVRPGEVVIVHIFHGAQDRSAPLTPP